MRKSSTATPIKSKRSETQKAKAASADCCASSVDPHPDHSDYLPRLRRAQGQLAGIERMISEQRYCVDILVQFRAVMAALRGIEVSIFETHLQHCVSSAL